MNQGFYTSSRIIFDLINIESLTGCWSSYETEAGTAYSSDEVVLVVLCVVSFPFNKMQFSITKKLGYDIVTFIMPS